MNINAHLEVNCLLAVIEVGLDINQGHCAGREESISATHDEQLLRHHHLQ